MLLSSLSYIFFLSIVFVVFLFMGLKNLRLKKWRWVWLLTASFYFYYTWSLVHLVLLLMLCSALFIIGRMLVSVDSKIFKQILLFIGIILPIALLVFFKYYNFLGENFAVLFAQDKFTSLKLILPIGISFFTFQLIGYVVDVYRGKQQVQVNFGKFILSAVFFPKLIAGPIENIGSFTKQLDGPLVINLENLKQGTGLILWGLVKKLIIADRAALFVNFIFLNYRWLGGSEVLLGSLLFSIQIYADFSGYTDIARGSARLFGIKLTQNFNFPYFSKTISEFWQRWHVSLSTWLRSYVYISLGGNRVSIFRSYLNVLITFLVSGLWHGANWTFIAWGGFNGSVIMLERVLTNIRKIKAPEWLKMLATFLVVNFLWIFFRADSFMEALRIIKTIFINLFSNYNFASISRYGNLQFVILILASTLLFLIDWKNFKSNKPIWKRFSLLKPSVKILIFSLLIVSIFLLGVFNKTEFLYSNF